MKHDATFDWVYILILLSLLGSLLLVQFRYFLRRHRSFHWPTIDATIQKGSVGFISYGRYGSFPASFLGYVFVVQSVRYAGLFALYGDATLVRKLNDSLAGTPLPIRYDPSDPNISYLANSDDSRFEGLDVSQDPQWLNQAPALDLQDAIRNS